MSKLYFFQKDTKLSLVSFSFRKKSKYTEIFKIKKYLELS